MGDVHPGREPLVASLDFYIFPSSDPLIDDVFYRAINLQAQSGEVVDLDLPEVRHERRALPARWSSSPSSEAVLFAVLVRNPRADVKFHWSLGPLLRGDVADVPGKNVASVDGKRDSVLRPFNRICMECSENR